MRYFSKLSKEFFQPFYEEECMIEFIRQIDLFNNVKILDVGCGYGRNIKLIKESCSHIDIIIEGVDVNQHIIDENRGKGIVCYTVEEFSNVDKQYDCMIFSHIIEHFQPNELKDFMDFYLDKLKDGGYIIIATPLLWKGFYWDFDHIKMYHPIGINMVFGSNVAQVQYYSKNNLTLQDIWFRKSPYMIHNKRGLYVKNRFSNIYKCIDLFYELLFKISGGLIGKTTGWMGLYRKNLIKSILAEANIKDYSEKSIGIWGTGDVATQILGELNENEKLKICGFFNGNDLNLIGSNFGNFEILDYRKINEYNLRAIIIATYKFNDEIENQIKYYNKDKVIKIINLK